MLLTMLSGSLWRMEPLCEGARPTNEFLGHRSAPHSPRVKRSMLRWWRVLRRHFFCGICGVFFARFWGPVHSGFWGQQLCNSNGGNPVTHSNSKHIDVRHYFPRKLVEKGEFNISHVQSKFQHAEFLTKLLSKDAFRFHRNSSDYELMLRQIWFWMELFNGLRYFTHVVRMAFAFELVLILIPGIWVLFWWFEMFFVFEFFHKIIELWYSVLNFKILFFLDLEFSFWDLRFGFGYLKVDFESFKMLELWIWYTWFNSFSTVDDHLLTGAEAPGYGSWVVITGLMLPTIINWAWTFWIRYFDFWYVFHF